ncbi:MAG: EAL domain-containing protein [Gammaproteobacteria bacterium]|nr:EAL domain-containing protein [Gammaproteobacteria bacterium]MCP5199330.1 EAL domain-containing protein [Gammaproteobacteria bacterium]
MAMVAASLRSLAQAWQAHEGARLAGALCLVAVLASMSGLFVRWDNLVYDAAMALREQEPPSDLVIVAIDDKSLRQMGQWPWSRRVHGELVERLAAYGARAVAFDVAFAEPADADGGDRRLAGAIAANGRVVLPVFPDRDAAGGLHEVLPLPVFANVVAKLGHVDTALDADAITRGAYLKAGIGSPVWPTLALALLELDDAPAWQVLPGRRREAEVVAAPGSWVRDNYILLGFNARAERFRQVSYVDVLRGEHSASQIAGRYVLVGVTAAGLAPGLTTPVSGHGQPMPGVEFNATVLDNLRRASWITPIDGMAYAALLSLFALIPALTYPRCSPRVSLVVGTALVPVGPLLAIGLLLFAQRWFAPAPAMIVALISYPLWSWRHVERAARTLRVERELGRATLSAIDDAVVTTDLDSLVTHLNPAAERLAGVARRDALGRHVTAVFWAPQADDAGRIGAVIAQALSEHRAVRSPSYVTLARRAGDASVVRVTASPLIGPLGDLEGTVVAFHDMTTNLSLSEQLAHQSSHDALTSLPNRGLLADRVTQAIAAARRAGGSVAVLFLDLDNFNFVNSTHGHHVGDELLVAVATRLNEVTRAADTVARWDGDQFAILIERLGQPDLAGVLARKFIEAATAPYPIGDQRVHLTACVGIALYPQDAADAAGLFACADDALHRIKRRERNEIGYFDEAYNRHARLRLELENGLRLALEQNQFEIYYQPQIALVSGRVIGAEALLRWHHPERGLLLPGEYVPIAEDSSLIHDIGRWVLGAACRQAAAWRGAGIPLQVGVNISARQLSTHALVGVVREALATSGARPGDIMLEVTESALMIDPERARSVLDEIRALGIRIAIDDFGTGYASLSNLKRLPVDQVKIDQSFVRDIVSDAGDAAITQAIIVMAHSMGLSVIAEGVETDAQLAFLREQRCDEMQGFLLSTPRPADELARWLSARGGVADLAGEVPEQEVPPVVTGPSLH